MMVLAPNDQASTRIHHTITRKRRSSHHQSQTRFSCHGKSYAETLQFANSTSHFLVLSKTDGKSAAPWLIYPSR